MQDGGIPRSRDRAAERRGAAGEPGEGLDAMSTKLFRATVMHTPQNPFMTDRAFQVFSDGAVAVRDGRVLAVGDYHELRSAYPDAGMVDRRGAYLLPGFIDTHVHYPQVNIIGAMGTPLLEWLERRTLPEERRFADATYALPVARRFLRELLQNGTTGAMVFGCHFEEGQDLFFQEAEKTGMTIASGLVLSDRNLLPELHTDPQRAYDESRRLIQKWHGKGRLRYAVTPRFAVSASEPLLEAAQALMNDFPGVLFQTHLNENRDEIRLVGELFPDALDYLDVYARFDLVRETSVFAHNVHTTPRELGVLAASRATVAHCPSSNAFLGSGLFPMQAHAVHGVRFALGTDVGAGVGFSIFKEALAAYQAQMLQPEGYALTPVHLLYLATKAGALALGVADEAGDFEAGKRADMIVVRPPADSLLETVLDRVETPVEALAAIFTLARAESVSEVYLAGALAYDRGEHGAGVTSWR